MVLQGISPFGKMYLTLVGCWRTGSMAIHGSTEFEEFRKQAKNYEPLTFVPRAGSTDFAQAQEVGYFKFGSAVVMVFEAPKNFTFDVIEGQKLRYGQRLGKIEPEDVKA